MSTPSEWNAGGYCALGKPWNQIPTGKTLPVGGRDFNLLDKLLEPLIHVDQRTGQRIILKTTRQKIERYHYLIFEDPA